MRTNLTELREFLNKEFKLKKEFNSAYSQKAFSRDLNISATTLNEFLNGTRDLSFKNLNSIFKYINSKVHCSFCDRPQKEADYLIAGPRKLFICDGTVVPCCLDKEAVISLGNCLSENLTDILSSSRAIRMKEGFKQGKLVEELCQRCDYITRFKK